ncbi:MAG: cbb3-type cytochrome oxidase assembly protein CcoS [Desulfatirhabdiaceae bacterium]
MYISFFLAYMTIGFGISGLVFYWAIKNGQFRDQKRAAFLPLQHDTEIRQKRISRVNRFEAVILIAMACIGLMASASVLIISLIQNQ